MRNTYFGTRFISSSDFIHGRIFTAEDKQRYLASRKTHLSFSDSRKNFYPMIAAKIVDDQARAIDGSLENAPVEPLDPNFQYFLANNSLCRKAQW